MAYDCGICEKLQNCAAQVGEKQFYTLASRLLCSLVEINSASGEALVAYSSPIVSLTEYAVGDLIGGLLNFTVQASDADGVEIVSARVTDLGAEGKNMDLVLFGSEPAATTFTDNAPLDIADADLSKVFGVVSINSHVAFADNGVSQATNVGLIGLLNATNALYGALVARELVTFDAANVLSVMVGFKKS